MCVCDCCSSGTVFARLKHDKHLVQTIVCVCVCVCVCVRVCVCVHQLAKSSYGRRQQEEWRKEGKRNRESWEGICFEKGQMDALLSESLDTKGK